ncbi:MAG: Thiol:disulfide interchange protein DsbD precursor [candidate division WS6 bacterium OLB20]|uniref:Thiol:disulfide interchange protein DsbD n=1 Tax=candidate division WS6 bacterium OLB20 TaxID=1617426 RepID=A0A136LXT6_9BACT|nr:MAG: Thiol:disulfide interchange protein DsbD precursor [candidate division WS6 bacterium OLB20]
MITPVHDVNLITAFVAGLLTFFAPCTFVTLPTFISYLVFRATGEDTVASKKYYRQRVLLSALSYVAGFLLVFVLLGMSATGIGSLLMRHTDFLQTAGAVTIILFGLFILFGERFKRLQFLFRERKVEFNTGKAGKGYVYPFIIGVTSAFAWTPCIGPILGSILLLAGTASQNVFEGGFLLLVFGLGITVPFMLLALFFGSAQKLMRRINRYTRLLHQVSAVLLIILGIMLLTGGLDQLYGSLYRIFTTFGYQPV